MLHAKVASATEESVALKTTRGPPAIVKSSASIDHSIVVAGDRPSLAAGKMLGVLELKQPRSPSVPHVRPWYSASHAWQASSTTASLCFFAIALMGSMSHGNP